MTARWRDPLIVSDAIVSGQIGLVTAVASVAGI
jgi:hypothetical protein